MQLTMPLRASLLIAGAAAALPAQDIHRVSPIGHANAPAATSTSYPWGYPSTQFPQFRYQQIHDELAGRPRLLLGLAIRRKHTAAAHPGMTATLKLDVSTAAVPSQQATATYASNHGANLTTVVQTRPVNFPPTNPTTNNLAAPLDHVIAFDQPYLHGGRGGVCWEVLMTANTNTVALPFDLAYNGVARNQAFGTGCGGVTLTGSYTAPHLTQVASGLTPNAPAVLLIGVSDERAAGGVPLPFDLTAVGAPGCALYVDPLLTLSVLADAAGTAMLQTDVSQLPPLTICVQAAAPTAASPFGWAFSNGLAAAAQVPRTFMRLWGSNVSAPTGSLQLIYALVVDFVQP